jgi:signal transduction histidine kinase
VFLVVQTDQILARARAKATARSAARGQDGQLEHGTSLFLAQLADTLRREQELAARPTSAEIGDSAAQNGRDLRRTGITVAQVVHEYGDLAAAITELAIELGSPISTDEFRTLNRCLDEAVAQAVTEYDRQRELSLSHRRTERLGFFAHELQDRLADALGTFETLKGGTIGIGSSTGAVLGRSLLAMRDLIDRSLAQVRLEAGLLRREPVPLGELMEEVGLSASIEANARHFQLTVESNGGEIRVRSVTGQGCVYTIDLPRLATATGRQLFAARD